MSVLLPDPDGPMMATISPASIVDVDAAERLDVVVLAELVGLAQRPALEQVHRSISQHRVIGSLVAQRRDRVEPGGVERGDEAGDRAEDRREGDGGDRRPGRELEQDRARRAARLVDDRDDDRAEERARWRHR